MRGGIIAAPFFRLMNFRPFVLFITALATTLCLWAQTTAAHKPAAQKVVTKKAVTKKAVTKKATPVKKSTPTKKGTAAKGKRATWTPRQSAPTPDRYKEIQGALAAKGYFKAEPSGVWDAQSVDAMKRYQADQKQDASGRITAASLIGLGLGPKTASSPAAEPVPAQP
jgi:hypothetical protein